MSKKRKIVFILAVALIIYVTFRILKGDSCGELHEAEQYHQALNVCLSEAENGDPQSQYYLAEQYLFSLATDADYTKAKKWYQLSAEQGNADAQDRLGYMYFMGVGGSSDIDKAIEWYQKGCHNGNNYSCDSVKYLSIW